MRRPVCLIEPHISYAGEVSTWKFIYTTSTNLPKGTRLKFDLQSEGRDIDWEIPQTNVKEKNNLIWGIMPDEKTVSAKILETEESITPEFEFVLPAEIVAGDSFTIAIGTPLAKGVGSRAQTVSQRRRTFLLYIDPKGKGDYKDPEVFSMDIKGNTLQFIKIIAPSIVARNKRFDVVLRFEDAFGNLTNYAPEGTLIELSYEHLRENLSWKLFIPETGFLALPNLYFNESGVYKIQLYNMQTGERFYSHPIKCFAEQNKGLFWGLLHGESERVDSAENIESCLRHLRDEKSLHFFGTSCFENVEETSNEIWKRISNHIIEFNEDNRFVAFLGMQWFGEEKTEGLRTFLFSKDNKAILRKKDSKNSNLQKIYKGLLPKELISIPSFSMAKNFVCDFTDFEPEFERVVEIYNAWGSSECLKKEGNTRPIVSPVKGGVQETAEGSIRAALNKNCRFGFVAGGLDDRGVFSGFFEGEQVQYSPGLTGIMAADQTRDSLFQALYHRSCYATTGERIIVGFFIAGMPMGSELNTKAKPGLMFNRHITGYVAGTSLITSIEVIRNGVVVHEMKPNLPHLEFTYDDTELLQKIALTAPEEEPSFVYYYLRITQENGHIAWSSPIWIDVHESIATVQKKVKKK